MEEGETEEGEAEGDTTGRERGYNYLLSMPIWSLTHERVQKLQAEAASQADLVRRLTATTNRQMWAQDLEEFVQVGWGRRGGG